MIFFVFLSLVSRVFSLRLLSSPSLSSRSKIFSSTSLFSHLNPLSEQQQLDNSKITFSKYHGIGNDFVLIDNTQSADLLLNSKQCETVCDRHRGVGADGVIFALPASNGCEYAMRIFNSDGSEPEMCGNGIRCLVNFLHSEVDKKNKETTKDTSSSVSYNVWTNAGKISTSLSAPAAEKSSGSPSVRISVDMGEPVLRPSLIPCLLSPLKDRVVLENMEVDKFSFNVTAVSMGNPHVVIFVPDLEKMSPSFEYISPLIMRHYSFPKQVNVHFAQVLNKNHVKVKTWERGVGPTLACGTGACSVVVAGTQCGVLDRDSLVSLPGGDLHISWNKFNNKVFMTGPAQFVYRGIIDKQSL